MELVRTTQSLCPECLERIEAQLVEVDNKIYMQKTCPTHGYFEDLYWSDASLYRKYMDYFRTKKAVEKPHTAESKGCPFDCGICPSHKSNSILANIDLTNACNMNCNVCFANANQCGYLFEPTLEQIALELDTLANERPARCYAVQFAGGEPTMRKEFIEIVKMAKERGFQQIQVATNGIKLAASAEFCREITEAGINTIYLQFDGITPEPHMKKTGFNALPIKLKAIENIRNVKGAAVVLVPTVVRGVNDNQLWDIIKFAAENFDVVRAVNFQPVSFAGRVPPEELKNGRITIPDVLNLIEKQSKGVLRKEDFLPTTALEPILELIRTMSGQSVGVLSTHPLCGVGTYLYKEGNDLVPLNKVINLEKFIRELSEMQKRNGKDLKLMMFRLASCVNSTNLKSLEFVNMIMDIFVKKNFRTATNFHKKLLFVGMMHFMDAYNYDIERSERCCIHYACPDGRIIPFCPYNTIHRPAMEKKFAKVHAKQPAIA